MADKKPRKNTEPEGPSQESMSDYDWLDKPMNGYPSGTMLDLGDGEPIDLSKVPDVFGTDGKSSSK